MSNKLKKIHIDQEIYEQIKIIASRSNMRKEKLIEQILTGYIHNKGLDKIDKDEKRRFKRRQVVIPAIVYDKSEAPDTGRYFSTTIFDISPSGVSLVFPLDRENKIDFTKDHSDYELMFYFRDCEVISCFKCKPGYVVKNDYNIKVGGSFVETDDLSHEQLSRFFMKIESHAVRALLTAAFPPADEN